MNKTLKYTIQSLALLIYGILAWRNFDNVYKYFYLVVLCCFLTVISLLYVFFNRKTITADESHFEFISIFVYVVVIIIVSMWFLM